MANNPVDDSSITRVLLREAALKRGLQVSYVGPDEYFMQLTDSNQRSELLLGTLTKRSSSIGNIVSHRKHLTIDFINSLGIATPDTLIYQNRDQAMEFLRRHGEIVVKPSDGGQSKGVTADVKEEPSLNKAVDYALANSIRGIVLMQQQLDGKLYRLFVLDGKLVAAAHRKAAEVIGDGVKNIQELINQLNQNPLRSDTDTTPLKRVNLDDARAYLGDERLSNVPVSGEIVKISAIDSVSAGGEAENVTDSVHPDYARLSQQIASGLGLFVCGFDIMCADISQPPAKDFIPLLEINSMPGLKLHHYPTGGGEPIDLAGMIIDRLFELS